MEGTDINTGNIDTNYNNDHSYFGNGCPNTWGTDGNGGSTLACSTRLVQVPQNEIQEIGTYYNYQAATSGSGAATTTNESLSPDSFCPLGWQMPYGGTGGDYYNRSKSLRYLLNLYSLAGYDVTIKENLHSYPFSHAPSGDYSWGLGRLYYMQGVNMFGSVIWWTQTVYGNNGYTLNNTGTTIKDPKIFGYVVRCFAISIRG